MSGDDRQNGPPAAAQLLVAALVTDPSMREAVLGDLCEEHAAIAERESDGAADRWYWSQLARSIAPFLMSSVPRPGRPGALKFLAGLLGGYAVIVMLLIASFTGIGWLLAVAMDGEYVDGVVAFSGTLWFVWTWSAFTAIVAGATSGYAVARVNERTGLVSAIVLGAVCIAMSAVTIATDASGAPVWSEVALSALVLPGTLGGALLHAKQRHYGHHPTWRPARSDT